MGVEIEEYINVVERANDLGLNAPTGISILPRYFSSAEKKEDLVYEVSSLDIRTLWKKEGVEEDRLDSDGDSIPYISEKSADWVGPTIFLGVSLLSEDNVLISIALNVIGNYLSDLFRGALKKPSISLDVVAELTPERKYLKIRYEGDAEGITGLENIVKEARLND